MGSTKTNKQTTKQSHGKIRQKAFCLYHNGPRDFATLNFPWLFKKDDGVSDLLASKG